MRFFEIYEKNGNPNYSTIRLKTKVETFGRKLVRYQKVKEVLVNIGIESN